MEQANRKHNRFAVTMIVSELITMFHLDRNHLLSSLVAKLDLGFLR